MALPGAPLCCPKTLVLRYVTMTAKCAAPGSALLRSLVPPFAPLSAKTVGSVTKQLLSEFGVQTTFFGPHSTRGAAVKMFKKFGLSSDQVAQLGKWKNLGPPFLITSPSWDLSLRAGLVVVLGGPLGLGLLLTVFRAGSWRS